MARRLKARSIIVSRKHAREMAIALSTFAYHLREFSGLMFVLSEQLGTATPPPRLLLTPDHLMTLHEILRDDAEYLDHMKVFLGHLVYQEAPLASTKAQAKMIGDGTSTSR